MEKACGFGTVIDLSLAFAKFHEGKAMVFLINRVRLEHEGLYPVLSLALALFTYGITAAAGGSGFLAIYLAGLMLGNSEARHRDYLTRFHSGLAWLMQILMFLTLGLQVFPSRIVPVIGVGLVLSIFLILVARPASVFLTLLPADFTLKEKLLISWVGLRGAVPIILATFPLIARIPKAEMIFNLVFFIVLSSILLQGTSLPIVARRLGLSAPEIRAVPPLSQAR